MLSVSRRLLQTILTVAVLSILIPIRTAAMTPEEIPAYTGEPYQVIHGNVPEFTDGEKSRTSAFENYHKLDALGRCGEAYANVGKELMPIEDRGAIGAVKPTGWHTIKYDSVDGRYLYNRCHLIGYQLTGENANKKNLITGTRYLNIEGMLPFENMVADYVKETNHHVLYRVTPMFHDNDLVAKGVEMEGWSVEDQGQGICFHVFAYNVQPGIVIDYTDGTSAAITESVAPVTSVDSQVRAGNESSSAVGTYILNTNTKKFHKPECSSVSRMSPVNKREYTGSREDLLMQGYDPCKNCNP